MARLHFPFSFVVTCVWGTNYYQFSSMWFTIMQKSWLDSLFPDLIPVIPCWFLHTTKDYTSVPHDYILWTHMFNTKIGPARLSLAEKLAKTGPLNYFCYQNQSSGTKLVAKTDPPLLNWSPCEKFESWFQNDTNFVDESIWLLEPSTWFRIELGPWATTFTLAKV